MKDTRPWLLDRVTRYAVDHPAPIVAGTLAVVVPISSGIFRLQYESNYIKSFDAHSRVVRDYQFVESRLGGIGVVYLVATNVAKMHLGTLRDFDGLDSSLRSLADAHGAATFNQVISLATLLDSDGLLAQAASPGFDPVGTKLDLIAASPQGDLLDSFWNREKGLVRVLLRLSEQQSADQKDAAFRSALTAARRALPGETFLTGLSHLLTQTTRGVIQAQWSTVAWSIGGILLALTLAFRDPILAALALLPSLIAVGLSLGLMGWLGISLDLATALVGSVALGLSVDDTFHCLLEFQHRRADSLRERLLASYSVTGPGVLLSSFAVAAGFLVLRASPFVPFVNFGSMVGVATLGSSIGNVILLPAFLSLAHQVSRARPSLRDRSKA
jgi:predicted RND superfamily exporter protein